MGPLRRIALLTVAPLLVAAGVARAEPVRSLSPGQSVRLSDEMTLTRWANIAYEGGVFARPDGRSKRIARLRWLTEDGFPEVYLALRGYRDARGRDWIKLRIPMRPNGRRGWVRRAALGSLRVTHSWLVVDRDLRRISFYEDGVRRWKAPVGIGKASTPTPAGRFWIRERFRVTDPASPYGPYALGTAAYANVSDWPGGGVVGLHGDFGDPGSIPGRPSHGCIRLRSRDVKWLARHAGVGTPLLVKR